MDTVTATAGGRAPARPAPSGKTGAAGKTAGAGKTPAAAKAPDAGKTPTARKAPDAGKTRAGARPAAKRTLPPAGKPAGPRAPASKPRSGKPVGSKVQAGKSTVQAGKPLNSELVDSKLVDSKPSGGGIQRERYLESAGSQATVPDTHPAAALVVDDHPAAAVSAPLDGANEEADANPYAPSGLREAGAGLRSFAQSILRDSGSVLQAAPGVVGELVRIARGASEVSPEKVDKRFTDPAWDSSRYFRTIMQAYLYLGSRADGIVDGLGLEGVSAQRARFAIGLIRDSLAPTNSILTNPAALRLARDTRGRSLRQGLGNRVGDLRHNHGMPAQVDRTRFTVGTDLAATPGAVIYRNEVFELIHYAPQCATVHQRPLLIVPPQVNKYYALDLAPGRSMCEHMLRKGFQLYCVSWRNPTAAQRDWEIDTYARAVLDAIDVVCEVSGSPDVNLMGGCLGGMMASIVAALLTARGDRRVHSVTTIVTLLDCDSDTQILLFATPLTLNAAKRASARTGVLDGWQMAEIFSWLRPNDLVWNYWVNNYLLGRKPPAFDILAWNADTTRLPARFHHQVLKLVSANQLTHAGALEVLGTPIDLSRITCDTYVVGGRTDHIIPWQDCYRTTQMVSGNSQFVLCSSGHIQTVVAAPDHPRLGYFVNPRTPGDPAEWMAAAVRHEGSWWDHWAVWLADRSGETTAAPGHLGSREHPAGDAAPGTYIFQ